MTFTCIIPAAAVPVVATSLTGSSAGLGKAGLRLAGATLHELASCSEQELFAAGSAEP